VPCQRVPPARPPGHVAGGDGSAVHAAATWLGPASSRPHAPAGWVRCCVLDWTGSVSSRRGERKNGGRRDAPAPVVRSVRGVPTFRTGSECLHGAQHVFRLVLMLGFQINSFSSLKNLNL